MADTGPSAYRAPALDKGLDILELVAAAPAPLGLAQLAEQLGRSKSEIFRMLRTLEERGYLGRDDADRYALTTKLFALAMATPPVANLVAEAMPVMQHLAEDVRQSCHLAVASGPQIIVVARVESPDDMGFSVRVGHHRGLLDAGSGRVLLAFADPDTRAARLALLPARRGLHRALDEIAARGYEQAPSAAVEGVTDLACPVFDGTGATAVASLTVPFVRLPGRSPDLHQVRRRLQAAATELSETLRSKAS